MPKVGLPGTHSWLYTCVPCRAIAPVEALSIAIEMLLSLPPFMRSNLIRWPDSSVTAIQIVMLALLNDGAILSIAYDNVRYRAQPEAWNMRLVLGIATVLGIVGPIAAFGLFYLSDKVFHLDHAHLQTLMYLTLSVAGHLTIFLARTRGPFWSIRPARVLLLAVLGT